MSGVHVAERLDDLQAQASSAVGEGISVADQLALIEHVRTLQKRNENLSAVYRGATKSAELNAVKLARIRALVDDDGLSPESFREGVRYWLDD